MKKTGSMPHWLLVLCCCGMSASSIGLGINSMGLFNGPVSAALGVGITAGLHLWKHNTLLSIIGGTVCYMFLAQVVF